MSSKIQEIQDILRRYERLQAEQTALVTRLAKLTLDAAETSAAFTTTTTPSVIVPPSRPSTPDQERQQFVVGDRVTIKNPNPGQPRQGVVTKIGTRFVTIRGANGTLIDRAAHNLDFQ